eukprot:gene8996-8130_t
MQGVEGHSCVASNGCLLIFGGKTVEGFTNALLRLSFVHPGIAHPHVDATKGVPPSPRAFHSALVTGNLMLVYGGVAPSPSGFVRGTDMAVIHAYHT